LVNGYERFDNNEINSNKDALIQERVGLVSVQMYKYFLDFQNATVNMNEVFSNIIRDLKAIEETLKKSFSSRGIPTQSIYTEYDAAKSYVTINILWNTISLTTRCNYKPQVLYRDQQQPFFSNRIMAVRGNYTDIIKGAQDQSECMKRLLDNEIASLYIPPDKMRNAIFKIRNLSNREFNLNFNDCAKEFVLKVIEIVCGDWNYHEEGSRKSFNI